MVVHWLGSEALYRGGWVPFCDKDAFGAAADVILEHCKGDTPVAETREFSTEICGAFLRLRDLITAAGRMKSKLADGVGEGVTKAQVLISLWLALDFTG